MTNRPANLVNKSLDHALRLASSIKPVDRLRTHRGENIVASRQTNEQGEWHKPNTKSKVRRDLREARNIGLVVVRGTLVHARLRIGEMTEPNIVIDQNKNYISLVRTQFAHPHRQHTT